MAGMCGRYLLRTPAEILAQLFGIDEVAPLEPRFNAAPTQTMPVVRVGADSRRHLDRLRWGLVPSWSKDASGAARMINARGETVAEKPAFRSAFRRRRCLVPADGFYEWKKVGSAKQPVLIRARSGGPLVLAGLWESWAPATGEPWETFTIVTTEANRVLREVHDRMPVVLAPEDFSLWLDPEVREPEALVPLLVPAPSERFEWVPVSRRVNNVRNDDPGCAEPEPVNQGEPEAEP